MIVARKIARKNFSCFFLGGGRGRCPPCPPSPTPVDISTFKHIMKTKCRCSSEPCDLDCPHGFRRDLLGLVVCDCADDPTTSTSSQSPSPTRPAPPTCPPLIGCTKECLYGYRTDRYGCSRCRCSRCPPFNCAKKCRDGFAYSSDGCRLCRCLGQFTTGVFLTFLYV